MLTAMGFQVEATDRARKALERLDAGTAGIDLLLTDVIMPDGLNGVELATLIRARFPALPIILISGYNDVACRQPRFPCCASRFRTTNSIVRSAPA